MRARSVLASAGACALAVGIAACSTSGSAGGSSATITGKSLTVYSSLALHGAAGSRSQAIVNGAKLAVEDAGGKVGKYTISYRSLDDSTASAGRADDAQTGRNARKAVGRKSTIGYVGEYDSGATKVSLPILNQGGIAQVSPTNAYVGLTTNKVGSEPDEPGKYYPTSKRTYARIVPTDIVQGGALASAAKQDGCKSIHIWNSKTTYSTGLARNLAMSAKQLGLTVEGNDGIDPKAASYRQQAAAIKADCFVFTGEIEANAVQAVKDVATTHPKVKLYGGDAVTQTTFADPKNGLPTAIGNRFKGTLATLDPSGFPAAGKKFFTDYAKAYTEPKPSAYAIYGYEAMSLLLDAVRRADASTGGKLTRESVYKALLDTKNRQSVLGNYSIDSKGDTTLTDYGLYKVSNGKLEFDRVIKANGA